MMKTFHEDDDILEELNNFEKEIITQMKVR